MNLFQLRAFDAVAREGSFTRAAARLFISQPAVTGHIKALEEHYQITLLRRTARRVELTEEGTKLAAITRALFGLAEEAQAMLEANRQLLTGRLEVAADGPHLVMPMLASLRERYPGITVNLRLGNAQETLAALLSEHADVAVLTEVEARKGLHLQSLGESRICALVPQGHPWLAEPEGVRLERLDQVIMVLREPSSITRRTFDAACVQAGISPKVLLELDSREAVTEAVAAQLGVGVVSSLELSPDPRVRALPIIGEGLLNRHMLGCLERRRELRLIQAFLALAPTH
ncbi:aminoethylphosphonate catabolism associated LysR family transcriptional regulator [Pseudomonas chlororaphis]|uniref:LysR substrate-binding domain-containing protein n=1 Tax=Pseudomonas chlororaphis TaxID=587753 RepID=UPI00086681A8|nr:LysR substrate-binding domain-containing protein [Pseudomonas chlororaphis]AZD68177.1 Phosphonate uptake and metabolism regulator, LysR-family [Pseudomonas chlororaphis subsp. aurantiaca]AZD74373.1 Phosphonate uptake and metabolism regulator, LysR-family [Pseudomonas chlororaphis subsp. aurantiaca]QIT24092.1 LysR family transcriptional regulator [Pseudomonas chlororaphis subsp. aurantiaca]WDH02200.1 LysR substrate-binding domain-containing protein [Pseudomonas chlororaphis]WDH08952.1 LysR s